MKKSFPITLIATLLSLGLLASCGGGGGQSNDTPASEEEEKEEPEVGWPAKAIKKLFDTYGYEGFDIPALQIENAQYQLKENPLNTSTYLGREWATITINDVFESQITPYYDVLREAGWDLQQTFPTQVCKLATENGEAMLAILYNVNDIACTIDFKVRKDGEVMHKWPAHQITNYLTKSVTDVIPEFTDGSGVFEISVYNERLEIVGECNTSDPQMSYQKYLIALKNAGWTKGAETDENGYLVYTSPNNQIKLLVGLFTFVGSRVYIKAERIGGTTPSNPDNPGGNDNPGGGEDNPGGGGNEQSGPWPTDQINACFANHHVSDPFPSFNLSGVTFTFEENTSGGHTWFTLTSTYISVDAYNSSTDYSHWRASLTALGFHADPQDSSYTRSPNDQFMFTYQPTFTSDHENYEITITVMEVY